MKPCSRRRQSATSTSTTACAGDAELRADLRRLLAVHGEAGAFLDRPVEAWLAGRDDVPFTGTDRFRILRQVGAGGMGVVYEVHDTLRDEAVALKTLRRTGASRSLSPEA